MRRIAWFAAAALATACGTEVKPAQAPLDRIRLPTGLAVVDGRLLVASSNADLLYQESTGGTVIALDPSDLPSVALTGAVAIRSFTGDLAVARSAPQGAGVPDAEACGTTLSEAFPSAAALAVVATRGSNTLNVVAVDALGGLSCSAPGSRCGIGAPSQDPFATAIACRAGSARAFIGYFMPDRTARVSELDLVTGAIRSMSLGAGPVRAFAYDRARDRLYVAGLATGAPTPLRWIDLAGCTVGAATAAGGCSFGEAPLPLASPALALELRSIALAHPFPGRPQRAYVMAREYDGSAAAIAGGRNTDFGGVLLVVDLVETASGGVDPQIVNEVRDIGRDAQEVRVLPPRAGQRDVVAALTTGGALLIYDDETGGHARFGLADETGAPLLGHEPFALAVDPVPIGTLARVWVGSYRDSYVTPIDVPLAAPDQPFFAPVGTQLRITGRAP